MRGKQFWIRLSAICGMALALQAILAEAQVIKAGPASCPAVALTYDLCPVRTASGFDRELIDFLIEHKVPATFFMSGRWMAKHDAEVKKLLAVPFFEIGTHGEVHAHLPMHEVEEQQQEIMGPVRLLKTKYGRPATLFRPPYGEYNDQTVDAVKTLELKFILWNIESGDPDPTLAAEAIVARVQKRMKPGSVIVDLAAARGEFVICDEIDLCLTDFYRAALGILEANEAEMVIGSKLLTGANDDRPWSRHAASMFYNGLLRITLGFKGTDTHGIKAFQHLDSA